MTLHPIIAALRKHVVGVILIATQIALSLAIVCNALFIISERIDRVRRPTGADEANLVFVTQQWSGDYDQAKKADIDRLDAMQQEDLAALRRMPGVASAAAMSAVPLLNSTYDGDIGLTPGKQEKNTHTVFYYGDDRMISTLNLRVSAGRGFNASDVVNSPAGGAHQPAVVIVTEPLAQKLFPDGNAVGRPIYFNGSGKPSTIVGVVQRLQVSTTGTWAQAFTWNSTLVPIRLNSNLSSYAVRVDPGQLDRVVNDIPRVLYSVDGQRVLDGRSVRRFSDVRAEAYRGDIGMAILMSIICVILVVVTAAGIVGLTSFWVRQRYRQIGIRRALGARKIDIFAYFHLENLAITGLGVVVGTIAAIGLNLWLVQNYEMRRIPVAFVLVGVLLVVFIAQMAVFVPAWKASRVSPMAATR